LNCLPEFESINSLLFALSQLRELSSPEFVSPCDTLKGWSLERRNPKVIKKLLPFYQWLYKYYFRVQTSGWENIPRDQQVLLIGSHNGGLAAPDMLMMIYDWFRHFGTQRVTYALMDSRIWQVLPKLARLATQVGALQAHPRMAIAALERGADLLIYPGGAQDVFRPYSLRNSIHFCGQKGFIKLALEYQLPIIPFISTGAHSSLLVLADLYPQLQQLHQWGMPWLGGIDPGVFPIYLGLPWGLAIGPLPNIPLPVQLHTRVCPPIVFDHYGKDAARDRGYVQECYNLVCQLMQQELDQLVAQNMSGISFFS
jgi:1-acyl-sn-glycerol-3-phosphate acyltransferase